MDDTRMTLAELDERIAVAEENLRDLIEEAAAYAGAGDEERASERIAALEQELESLKKRREDLTSE